MLHGAKDPCKPCKQSRIAPAIRPQRLSNYKHRLSLSPYSILLPSASTESKAIQKFLSWLETGKNSLQDVKWGAVHESGVCQFQLYYIGSCCNYGLIESNPYVTVNKDGERQPGHTRRAERRALLPWVSMQCLSLHAVCCSSEVSVDL